VQRKLLLVDDEVGILRALRRLFRKAGYEIFIAESAEEALTLLRENEIPVILTDFRMPGADGGTLLARATEIDPACVGMILSGFAELKQVIGAFNSGVVHRFISKPWSDTELLEHVENAFDVAFQKRLDLDLDHQGLLSEASSKFSRHYPLNFVDLLSQETSYGLVAVEFASPRVLVRTDELNSGSALARLITELLESMPVATQFCHWSGYTVVLWAAESEMPEVMRQVDAFSARLVATGTQEKVLRYVALERPTGLGADQMRELLLKLAQQDYEDEAFGQSIWNSLLDGNLTQSLVDAVDAKAFRVVFQPICSDQDELVAVEALLRCETLVQAKVTLVSLIRQIDLLGYSEQFTEIQLKVALEQFASLNLPATVKLVLNFSLRQLSAQSLRTTIERQLEHYKLALSRLSIDVGESAIKSKIPQCAENLDWFRSVGVALTLDDQGSAQAYLNSEETLKVDAVKLDRAFLHDLDTQSNRQEMLVNLCDRILERDKRLSFEGVENAEQLKFIRTRYNFSYQGWALSKPLGNEELLAWYTSRADI